MTGRKSSCALARCLSFITIATLTPAAMAQWRITEWHQEVAPNGALRIVVPMHVPPAAGGLEPELSLVYNSNRGDSAEIGVGWAIGGLSMITRCAKTPGKDGVNVTVQYLASDAYCLDGERLIPINGVNGMDGTEYRTEHDTFAKIVSTGTQQALVGANWVNLGPQSFTVKTKSGRTLEYGVTANSKAQDPANPNVPIKAWGLNKLMDIATNYMTITYVTPTLDETGVVDACGAGAECASGFCADSVCCNSVCGGSATNDGLACSVAAGAATDGTRGMLVAGRTRTSTFEYDPVAGLKSAEVSEPDDSQLAVRTEYTRDNYGNMLTAVVSSTATGTSAITTRTTDTVTYSEGRVATSHKNALNQTTAGQFDSFNNPTYINDLNGVQSKFTFDMHGLSGKFPDVPIRPVRQAHDDRGSGWQHDLDVLRHSRKYGFDDRS